jgi:GNAT superfamily N-acetyltransferase/uncharacterized membrane protein
LASAVLFAWNLILQRQQAQRASPIEVAFFQHLVMLGIFALAAPFWAEPPPARAVPLVLLAATLAFTSLAALAWAYARAEAQRLIPVEYSAFIWAAIVGWLAFGERVTLTTVAGALLIVAACLISARAKRAGLAPPWPSVGSRNGMSAIVIREATSADISTICAFIRALADYERLAHEAKADPATLARHLFGPRPMAEVLIAEQDGAPVGFALFFHNFSTFEGRPGLYLEDLFVVPDARGSGAGKALLVRLAQLALARDCARLEWSVLDWNAPAIAFYRAIGARPMDEWTVQRLDGDALAALAGD